MSMRHVSNRQPSPVQPAGSYVVPAPKPTDLLQGTLRCAYGDAEQDETAFHDLVSALDRIPARR